MTASIRLFLALALLLGRAAAEPPLLKPDQAFAISSRSEGKSVVVHWDIADGYYLYRSKFHFDTTDPRVILGTPDLPDGEIKKDPFFGKLEIYRGSVEARIPVHYEGEDRPDLIELDVRSQGCADSGICFPPHSQTLLVALDRAADQPPPVARSAVKETEEALAQVSGSPTGADPAPQPETAAPASSSSQPSSPRGGGSSPLQALGSVVNGALGLEEEGFLPPDKAYGVEPEVVNGNRLRLHFKVAKGTYLYEDKLAVEIDGKGVRAGPLELPEPKIKHDTIKPDGSIGDVPVFVHDFQAGVPLLRQQGEPQRIRLTVKYQGCAEAGICYPPQKKGFELDLPATNVVGGASAATAAPPTPAPATGTEESEQDRIAGLLRSSSTWLVVFSFFGLGLLLSFTPCVFPMIPILSGIIAGQGRQVTARRAFTLSVVFVLAMAVTYTIAGVLAGLFGANLQAAFQNPWILSFFALIFVLLALSMFGFYDLQLPASWQSKLSEVSNRQQGGQTTGVAVMGLLSALIVGPCVAPPLAGALIFIGQTGDWLLGGVALFAMSLGMGAPLILIGTSAGKLLPKAGAWMDAVKAVFGVVMLGLAITMLERFLPEVTIMAMWGVLLVVSAVYMGALNPLPGDASGWRKLWKGLGVVLLIYGALFLVGVAANGRDTLQPLRGILPMGASGGPVAAAPVHFKRIENVAELDRELAAAKAAGRPVMLDFYADWCIYCKTLEKNVFPDPRVRARLRRFVLLQADVTDQNDDELALQRRFEVPAPPALIFWNAKGEELRPLRVMGDIGAEALARQLDKVTP